MTEPDLSTERLFRGIDRALAERPDRIFVTAAGGALTYGACATRMRQLAAAFAALDLPTGARVLLRSRDDLAIIPLFLALLRAGLVPVVADAEATDVEYAELAELCDVAAVFSDRPAPIASARRQVGIGPELDRLAEAAPPVAFPATVPAGVPAVLILTSGTTATPKAVELGHHSLLAQLDIFAQVYGFGPDLRMMNLLPLHHVDGLFRGPLATLWFGGTLDRSLRFSVQAVPAILEQIETGAFTHFISVPAMLRIIERVGGLRPGAFRRPGFRFVLSSADLLDAALWRRFETRFGVPVVNAYGLSEVVCDALFAGPDPGTRRIGSLGRPVGCQARILRPDGAEAGPGETGELVLSGPTVMQGYFNDPAQTAAVLAGGWFHTGDLARQGPDGLFDFVGRRKTAIVSAGQTIHPEAATQVLATLPGVAEAVAFGLPDPAIGERLVAAVVAEPGANLTPAGLAAGVRDRLSAERAPREYRVLTELPRGASGKVSIPALLAAWDRAAAPSPAAETPPDVLEIAATCFNVPVAQLSYDSTPFDTEGWDSLAHMTLIEALEEAFGIRFSALQIAQIVTLADARDFIAEQRAEA